MRRWVGSYGGGSRFLERIQTIASASRRLRTAVEERALLRARPMEESSTAEPGGAVVEE